MKEMHMHGLSRTRLYRIWIGMKGRCYNPNYIQYAYYGGKGIKVCDEWIQCGAGFLNFYQWAMKNGYNDSLSIDRIDPSMDYTPCNCRWADKYTQNVHLSKRISKSGYRGVCKHTNCDTWYGRVKVYGKTYYTGSADTPKKAAELRNQFIEKYGLINEKNEVAASAPD